MATSKSTLLTEADGRRLAVDMFLEMSELGMDELAIDGDPTLTHGADEELRNGRPQSEVLRRYLATARQNPAVEAGFLAVLTDALGSFAEGNAGDTLARFYEEV